MLLLAAPAWGASFHCDARTIVAGLPGVTCTISPPPIGSAYVDCLWMPGDGTTCDANYNNACTTSYHYEYTDPGTYVFRVVCALPHTTYLVKGSSTITVK